MPIYPEKRQFTVFMKILFHQIFTQFCTKLMINKDKADDGSRPSYVHLRVNHEVNIYSCNHGTRTHILLYYIAEVSIRRQGVFIIMSFQATVQKCISVKLSQYLLTVSFLNSKAMHAEHQTSSYSDKSLLRKGKVTSLSVYTQC
jgi:hypothetical protein